MTNSAPDFGIMFFSASEESLQDNKYRLVVEAARFADRHGFSSVWVPERHFASLGGLYPNPSVLHGAIALVTERIGLRAGSVVMPLHHPVRVAEEWSMVDNLSGGRVGLSFASGWNPNDFVFFPERYAQRRDEMYEGISAVQRLWRGETLRQVSGTGSEVDVRILPTPVQPELPSWITAARSPETFTRAGEMGANLLTHLLDQDVEELQEKVALYRDARQLNGFKPNQGVVTVMVHTFLSSDAESARETARRPYCEFLKSNASLLKGLAASRGESVDLDSFSEEETDAFVDFLYDRFVGKRSLIGSPETCRDLVMKLWAAGVDEVACLLDFGPSYETVLESLPELDRLRRLCSSDVPERINTSEVPGIVGDPPPGRTSRRSVELESLAAVRARCDATVDGAAFYAALERRGFEVAGAARAIQQVYWCDGEALARVEVKESQPSGPMDPAFLDACLQAAMAGASKERDDELRVPAAFGKLELTGAVVGRGWSHAVVRAARNGKLEADVTVLNEDEERVALVSGVTFRPIEKRTQPKFGSWLYELEWARSSSAAGMSAEAGSWLILADVGGVGAALAAQLESQGARCVLLRRQDVFKTNDSDDAAFDRFRVYLAGALEEDHDLTGVVHLWSLDVPGGEETTSQSLEQAERWGSASGLVTIQSLLGCAHARPPRLWVATRGAQPVLTSETQVAFAQSPVWGLGRTCAMEHPEVWGGLVDVEPDTTAESCAACIAQSLFDSGNEDQVAFRGGERYVVRLVVAPEPAASPFTIDPEGAYLITGGLWGLGLEVARWLVARGARHLVIVGRTPLPPRESWEALEPGSSSAERAAAVVALEADGAEVRYAAVDVADEDGVRALLRERKSEGAPSIRGLVHAASVWRDPDGLSLIRTLSQLDVPALQRVFAPKVNGTWVLHEALVDEPLDFFVMFSSAASLTGSAGQGNYAAASCFLDTLAHYRRRTGMTALCVNWGPVSGAGFGATEEGLKVHRYWEDNGLKRIDPETVVAALEALIPTDVAELGVMNIDWNELADFFPGLRRAAWARGLVAARDEQFASELLMQLRAAPADSRRQLLTRHVQGQVQQIMGLERLPDPRRRLFDMGMDSLMALDLKKRLQVELGADVPVTAVFNYPTIDALVGYVAADVLRVDPEDLASAEVPASRDSSALAQIRELSDEEAERRLLELTSGSTN